MYRFNGGYGAVTCDKCDIMIDEGLGVDEYREGWRSGKGEDEPDLCMKCKEEE